MVKKTIQYFSFVAISILIAGLYGVLHNQFTYLVSKEYFTHFKFLLFGLPEYLVVPERLGAAIVGWNASWWFGLIVGLTLGSLWVWENLLVSRDRYNAIATVVITALLSGVLGGIFAYAYYQPLRYYEVFEFTGYTQEIRDSLNTMSDPYAFLRASTIHNCSYIGAGLGLILGILQLRKSRNRGLKKK